ncbi:MAG TPA: HPr family phosphocarrier protein [bacterium]|nr:HPr family phosphocarrier protein [bacterium]
MLLEKELLIQNKLGLHARAAALLVKTANRFSSDVKITKDRTIANGKSIMGVLTLAAACGSSVKVSCEGHDAADAMKAIENLIAAKFNEGE